MSTHTYPLTEAACFFIDTQATMFILLKHAVKDNNIQPEIKNLIDTYGIKKVVYDNLIPEEFLDEYQDDLFARELIIDEIDGVTMASDFEGEITTKWSDKCGNVNPLNLELDDNFILYIRPEKSADFFKQAYANPEEMLAEFKEKLSNYLPDDFPFWKYIVSIDGTYYC